VRTSLLLLVALCSFGCGAADQAANDETQATVGSVDKARDAAGKASANVNAGEKTLAESEGK
jgi:hypothetical protein